MNRPDSISPLTIIAIFAGIIEASALASLPFLSTESQYIYTWFLVGFPFFLTVLFFLTLNFNYQSLWKPSSWLAHREAERSPPANRCDSTTWERTLTLALSGSNTEQEIQNRLIQAVSQALPEERSWVIYDLDNHKRICLTLTPNVDPPAY
ncbi:hypothetical protein SJI00_12430 [Pseudomonas sp. RP23018S]|uniref:hypothetical protein n=1 Tax=Pseudomonas sp. RP23018S TaxID=3096037 RepID=UPI002ACAFF79|nr:hypothetical protein [Pseudomonas sp. RP23018S]MDZ5603581.1 hypothetical protein [Pseudomonas sp. RP23018S]